MRARARARAGSGGLGGIPTHSKCIACRLSAAACMLDLNQIYGMFGSAGDRAGRREGSEVSKVSSVDVGVGRGSWSRVSSLTARRYASGGRPTDRPTVRPPRLPACPTVATGQTRHHDYFLNILHLERCRSDTLGTVFHPQLPYY